MIIKNTKTKSVFSVKQYEHCIAWVPENYLAPFLVSAENNLKTELFENDGLTISWTVIFLAELSKSKMNVDVIAVFEIS